MRIVTELPHEVRPVEHVEIPVHDGTRLAARMWLPEVALEAPVPAVLEYIPYRKRDATRARDELHHPYFAGHGYASVRVDLRGSGDSEGVLEDEYLELELDDGRDVLAWIADQLWCDGRVGVIGISWGGFNGLQLAARRPPELAAVISVASTDDRYADDVHYMGGCLLGDNLSWASTMFAETAMPPDPALRDDWRDAWLTRMRESGHWLDTWLRHQHRDAYWRHGSVCEDFASIETPVMAVSGWADGYTNSVFRLVEHLDAPCQGLVGPWSHRYPHMGEPGPAIGWLQECVRWWDRWLKGVDNGVDEDPALRAWVQDSAPPFTSYEERPGRWVAEPSWPSPHTRWERRPLASGRLLDAVHEDEGPDRALVVHSPLSVGMFAGKWCSYAGGPDLPGDQQEEDGGSLVFDTEPVEEDVDVLGAPVVELEVTSDVEVAMVAVRLSDIRPDRTATRISYGLLNLTHRDGHAEPQPLEPGERYRVRVPLNVLGHRLPAGHRLRLSVSTSYWPLAWLPPEPVTLTVHTAGSALHLPTRPATAPDGDVSFDPPEAASPIEVTPLAPGEHAWRVHRELEDDTTELEVVKDDGRVHIEDVDLEYRSRAVEHYRVRGDDVTSAEGTTDWVRELRRGDWQVEMRTFTRLTCDEDDFHLHATLDAYEGGERVHSDTWRSRIPRTLV